MLRAVKTMDVLVDGNLVYSGMLNFPGRSPLSTIFLSEQVKGDPKMEVCEIVEEDVGQIGLNDEETVVQEIDSYFHQIIRPDTGTEF